MVQVHLPLPSGPIVKRLRHRPFTAGSRVRIPFGSPERKKPGSYQKIRAFFVSPRGKETNTRREPMGHLGFSYTGLIFLLLLFIPNLLWARYMPKEGDAPEKENRILRILERDDFYGRFLVSLMRVRYCPCWRFSCWACMGRWCGWEGGVDGAVCRDFRHWAYRHPYPAWESAWEGRGCITAFFRFGWKIPVGCAILRGETGKKKRCFV